MVLVGRQAPDFTAAAVLGNGEIVDNFNFAEFTNCLLYTSDAADDC